MKSNTFSAANVGGIADQIKSLSSSDQAVLLHKLGFGTAGQLSDDALVTTKVAAKELGASEITLSIWRSTGRYHLPFIKIGRLVKYRMGDLREFKSSRRVDTRAECGIAVA